METDVLVVGAGPTGLTASILLARAGVSTITLSRYSGPAHTPRASVLNARTLEVFRDLDLEERIAAGGQPLTKLNHNILASTLSGLEFARYKSYGTSPERLSDYAAASPCRGHNVHQMITEPILVADARRRGCDIRYDNELVAIKQSDDEVRAQIVDRGTGTEYVVKAKYVIAADGGNSSIASTLGFAFRGEAGSQLICNAWVEVDLSKYTAYRPGVIYWTGQPGLDTWFGSGSWIVVRPWDEWSFIHPLRGNRIPAEADVITRARMTIGDPNADVRLKELTTWAVHNVVATEYRKGRVLLAGDAAHRHPPTGGLGANTSIQDAFNLSWKLAAVIHGHAGDSLLDSYEAERQPVGSNVVERSIKNFENLASFVSALGLREGQSVDDGWAAIRELFEDSPGATERREALREAVHLQHYRSNALGVDLGQRYTSLAVVNDGTPFPDYTRDRDLYYEATTHPGAYLPHAWIEHDQKRVSTIDAVGRGRFSLIVAIGGAPWVAAAESLAAEFGVAIDVVRIGLRCTYDDVFGEWEAVREISDQGALLVRPDRQIAWRSMGLTAEPRKEFENALEQILATTNRRGSEPAAKTSKGASQ